MLGTLNFYPPKNKTTAQHKHTLYYKEVEDGVVSLDMVYFQIWLCHLCK